MTVKNDRDYLYVIWKDPESRRQYVIGELSEDKSGKYEFCYCHEIDDARENGFELLISFDDVSKRYISNRLFPPFASRLPDRKRKDIGNILRKYSMTEYDEYSLLKRSGGALPIDNIKFIEPILQIPKDGLEKTFCIAGVRHWASCGGEECFKFNNVHENDDLRLELEPANVHDKYAVKVMDNSILIGYIPRYYSKELSYLINSGFSYKCVISKVQKNHECDECIQVSLKIQREKIYA
ncbi:DNA-binding protein [Clostridium fermenticellae]|uniref:DNA-binding protein n=1 Tax=Clostridium fermenticellae TaxID=2068654 RepID=A0A386H0V7_9CLOT|nr:HIRAN domain-containing protein [Clostridium fermenticellae]AYD39290.1 DNA-binding protein [Clostridium fermenticellae]